MFRKRPKLVHKNTKAATVEAAKVAAEAEAATRMEETKRRSRFDNPRHGCARKERLP